MSKRLRSAIVGLGQVGLLFDQDKRRQGVWTHFTAYERMRSDYELVAACDPDPARRQLAQRRNPRMRLYDSLTAMLRTEQIDILSLCTPPALHAAQIRQAAGRVRGILCEKPLSATVVQGTSALQTCRQTRTVLAVNYYKRYETGFRQLQQWIARGELGHLSLVRGIYAGPFEAVGSHLVDLFRFVAGEWKVRSSWRVGSTIGDAWNADMTQGSTEGEIRWSGARENLIFELEAIGDKGRARVSENGSHVERSRFIPSPRYNGYQELQPQKLSKMPTMERFLPLFKELAERVRSSRAVLQADGQSALATQRLMSAIQCR